jgi:hypothetical protein
MILEPRLRIKFNEEKSAYTVRASNDRFAICTKPFALKKTVFYTVIDWEKGIRGTENLIFGMGAETFEDCKQMLRRFTSGESQISHKNFVKLYIDAIRGSKL